MPGVVSVDVQQQHLLQMSIIIQAAIKSWMDFRLGQKTVNLMKQSKENERESSYFALFSVLALPVQYIMVTHCLHNDSYGF